ncbi:hypothetical protein ACFUV2_34745 [Streptomyces pilosus]|uniref:hypothetical protein n=1 Tax=Streptomyces pilosus TaxID=28893 RepID=UPI003630A6D2
MKVPDSYVSPGDRDQIIEMIGNAVTVNMGRDLVGMVEALTGKEVARPDVAMAAWATPVPGRPTPVVANRPRARHDRDQPHPANETGS